ncbi:MAG: MG2 domain-containing protein [Candidatus Azobacteroides sp.]|nr:MG2 domain-containing protein [Candidatus Azobacteroides sp.]
MKRYFLIFIITVSTFSASAQINPWDKVESFDKESLPQSALQLVNQIYADALKTGNSPELIKAIIYQLKYESAIDQDHLPEKIREIEQQAGTDQNPAEQSILYSLLAELYSYYFQMNFYSIYQRTALPSDSDEYPDIREWSANLFIRKITDIANRSLAAAPLLQSSDALKYKDILIEGKSSRMLRPTLYDLLSYRAIDLLSRLAADSRTQNYFAQSRLSGKEYFAPANEFVRLNIEANPYDLVPQIAKLYQQLLDFRLKNNSAEALVLADLDRLNFVKSNAILPEENDPYLKALDLLEEQYKKDDFCVEILYAKAFYYRNSTYIPYISDEMYEKTRQENIQKAYDICVEGIKQYPHYERIGILQNLLGQLTQSFLYVTANNAVYPGNDLTLKIRFKNLNKLRIEIYKVKAPVSIYANDGSNTQYKKSGVLIEKKDIELDNRVPYQESDITVRIPAKELGNYEYLVYASDWKNEQSNRQDQYFVSQQYSVSRLATVAREADRNREFLVVDRQSGKPIPQAQLNFYTRKNNVLAALKNQTLLTDKDGLASGANDKEVYFYNASFENDTALMTSPVPWISTFDYAQTSSPSLSLFSDRSIYRPGQTVYFKGIAYETGARVLPGKTYLFRLLDANNKEVSTQKLTTNEFGSLSGEFLIPSGALNGNYLISANDMYYLNFRVEEYKRPSFDISFDPNDKTYQFGDQATIKGQARTFSGVPLQDTEVRYRIMRQPNWLYRGRYYSSVQIADGTVQTKDDGSFEIVFTPEKSFEDRNNSEVYYTYTVEALITGGSGETQSALTNYFIGDKSMYLSVSGLQDKMNKDTLSSVQIGAFNLSGHLVQAEGTYQTYLLEAGQSTDLNLKKEDWKQGKMVFSGAFKSGETVDWNKLKSMPSGQYRLIARSTDEKGRAVEFQGDFTLFSSADKCPPVPVYEWFLTPKLDCAVGEKAEIVYGSSAKEVYVLYELFQGKKKILCSRFILNNENKKIEIPFLESYGDGITAVFSFVKEGQFFSQTAAITKRHDDKALQLKMEVFRDYLLPGQQEEWKVSVRDAKNRPALAELLASMYDASLDKIWAHSWQFNPGKTFVGWTPSNQTGREFESSGSSLNRNGSFVDVSSFSYDAINWFGFSIEPMMGLGYGRMLKGAPTTARLRAAGDQSVALSSPSPSNNVPMDAVVNESFSIAAGAVAVAGGADEAEMSTQIRQNFDETAFFYPHLRTDEKGETLISFTLPESNTRWKFMSLAHTSDLAYGWIFKEVVSQKKLMITPNVPRFIRTGDRTTISSDISNLSENNLSGTVRIECLDPNTEKSNLMIADSVKEFSVEAGKTVSASWSFDVPADVDLTTLKIVARSSDFSDGEQHLIPVLPNRMMVTESLPLNVSGGETRVFSFDQLAQNNSPSLENYRLTLEFTNNPVWYAVQALPTVATPQTDNVLSWFAAYFSHSIAVYLANSNPKIKQMIEVWTKRGESKESLLSALEKNQELKAVLLEETPWVMEAKNESEQKQRLSLLFDLNRTRNLNRQALDKLRDMQEYDGGWSWFKGMQSNVYITQWILYGMKKIEETTGIEDPETKEMQQKAVQFIDRNIKQHYDQWKKNNPKSSSYAPSTYELEYLLVRSSYPNIPFGESKEAVEFYTRCVEKYWTENANLYARAISALILQRNGKTETARAIIRSLREHASYKQDMGMYWANNNAYCFMTQSATCVHAFIMEAFRAVASTTDEMDKMKLWLLKQKQTQEWESVPATVQAIAILLNTGTDWLASEGKTAVKIGNKSIDTAKGEAGTGYFKYVETNDAPSWALWKNEKISVSKQDAGPAWGAVYWQYFEDLDKIKGAKTELNVEKSLFIEKTTSAGKVLSSITADNPLQVGDKVVVRLTIRTDRDIEYVLLKDLRASCFEPVDPLSGTQWKQGLIYNLSPKDASMNFFFPSIPKGTYVFEYPLYTTSPGDYSNGTATIQCLYAPEFVSHTSGGRVAVKERE